MRIVSDVSIDLKTLMAYKDKTVTQLTKGIEYLFKKNKVENINGFGTFLNSKELQVRDAKDNTSIITAKNFIIATGSEAVAFPGLAFDEQSVVSSTGALSFKSVPKNLVVIGGGVIGLELGSVWSRLGAKVTVVEFLSSIGGAGMDAATASAFQKLLTKQGIQFKLGTKVTSVDSYDDGTHEVKVEAANGGAQETLEADAVLVSIGRKPNTDGLGLENTKVKVDAKGRIVTDGNFCTAETHIRAIGDVIQGPMLAHKAEDEGIAAVNLLAQQHAHVNYDAIPSVVYTHPEVAWVGKSEEELKKANVSYTVGNFPFLANSRAKTNDDAEGFVKVLADSKSGQLLGCHIIGPNAGEMIAEATLAINMKLSVSELADTCHAHPTLSETFKEACMSATGLKKAIHF